LPLGLCAVLDRFLPFVTFLLGSALGIYCNIITARLPQ
jgi:hypothetical protein